MNSTPIDALAVSEQDRLLHEAMERDEPRLRRFIRRQVNDSSDVEDILQDVFYELIQAYRMMKPIEHVTGWLFRVARNRITDLFRKHKPENFAHALAEGEEGELLEIEDLLPSPDAGPEARPGPPRPLERPRPVPRPGRRARSSRGAGDQLRLHPGEVDLGQPRALGAAWKWRSAQHR